MVEPLDHDRHREGLYEAYSRDPGSMWTYLPYGPFDGDTFDAWLSGWSESRDPLFHAIVDIETNQPLGLASYLRIEPRHGVIEVGHISYSPLLTRTTGATEAMWLMMRRVFDELEYRRYEWKCDALNAPSRAAAARLGFTYEGTFRNHIVSKGRNRDTAWFSITDDEWSTIDHSFRAWLHASNFDAGRQVRSLRHMRAGVTRGGSPG